MSFKSVATRIVATVLFVGAVASCGGSDSDARTRNGMLIQKNTTNIDSCVNNNISNLNSNINCNMDNCVNNNISNLNSNTICDIDDNIANNNIINRAPTTTVANSDGDSDIPAGTAVAPATIKPYRDDVAQQNSATTTTVLATTTTVVSNDISNSMASCSITVTSAKLSACKAVTKVVYRLKRGTATVASGTKDVAPATKSLTYVKKPAKTPTKGTLTISFADGTSAAVSISKFDGKAITVYPK